MNRPVYITSDLHFGHDDCDRHGVKSMISRAEKEDAWIIVAGDWFELIESDEISVMLKYKGLIDRISARLLMYTPGNHDSLIFQTKGRFPRAYYPAYVGSFDRKRFMVTHGHLCGPYSPVWALADKLYKHRGLVAIARWIANRKLFNFAQKAVSSRNYAENYRDEIIHRAWLNHCDIVICGHSHVQEVHYDDDHGVLYLNPGSAIGRMRYIRFDGREFEPMSI